MLERNNDVKIGYISLFDLSDDEFNTLLDYFEFKKKSPSVRYLASLIGKEAFLEMMDLFSSDTIKMPTRAESIKILNYISIYHYLKDRDFSDLAYQKAKGLYKAFTGGVNIASEDKFNLTIFWAELLMEGSPFLCCY